MILLIRSRQSVAPLNNVHQRFPCSRGDPVRGKAGGGQGGPYPRDSRVLLLGVIQQFHFTVKNLAQRAADDIRRVQVGEMAGAIFQLTGTLGYGDNKRVFSHTARQALNVDFSTHFSLFWHE
jgi:hypothetical protein